MSSLRRGPVDGRSREVESANVLDDIALRDVIEVAIDDANVLYRCVCETAQIDAVHAPFTRHPLDRDVAGDRRERALVTFFVIEVDREDGIDDLSDGYIAHVDVVQQATAHRVVLE